MRILITGTPGTGKTEVARILASILGIEYVSIAELVEKKKIYEIEGGEKAVGLKKLQRVISDEFIGKWGYEYVIEGHLGCEIVVPVDSIYVLRTHPDILEKRMKSRKYPKKKIEENLEAEALDYCYQRVKQVYETRPIEIDTTNKTAVQVAERIANMIKYNKKVGDEVDFSGELKKKLGLKKRGKGKKVR